LADWRIVFHRWPAEGVPGARLLPSLAALACLSLALVGCAAPASSSSSRATPAPTPVRPSVGLAQAAATLAHAFMAELVDGNYSAQWAQLGEVAQAQWPSEATRTQMLAAKFQGASRVIAFTLGPAQPGTTWTSRETPRLTAGNVYSFTVSTQFSEPGQLRPLGVVSDYQSLTLAVAATPPARPSTLRIVGEGPASPNAPIIEPSLLIPRQAAVPILMYHLVGPYPIRSDYSEEYSYEIDYGLTVPPAQFSSEMGYLIGQHYTSISLVELADYLYYGLPLPPKPVVITFDDGFANEYQYAVPVLQADGLTATFLPCSGLIGEKNGEERYMPASQLADLASGGFWVEDHTYNDGTVLWGQSSATIQALAGNTAQVLEQITKQPIQFISYSGLWPYPSPQTVSAGQTRLFSQLALLGYVGGLEDNWLGRFPWQESSTNLWELPRVRAYPGEPLSVFAGLLSYG